MNARRLTPPWRAALLIPVLVAIATAALLYGGTRSSPAPRPVPNKAVRSAPSPASPAVVWAVGDGADGSDRARKLADLIARTGRSASSTSATSIQTFWHRPLISAGEHGDQPT